MIHEARQIFESTPELIKLFGRAVDDDALFHLDAMPCGHAHDWILRGCSSGGVNACALVHGAMPRCAAIDERAADQRQHSAAPRAVSDEPRDAVESKRSAAYGRHPALRFSDVN